LKSSTLSPGSKDFFSIILSCHLFVFSLYIFALCYAFSLHSSSSPNCIFLLIPVVGRSICHFLIAQCDLYSNSTSKFHVFPWTNW
jgi:hypothetical protein